MASELDVPSFDEIRSKTFECFNKRPCAWQVHVCQEVLRGDRDIISIAGTGMGKTLTFWMPLLFRPQGIQLIVTPLNILGEQNTAVLDWIGIKSIFISATTATQQNFRDIASLCYRVVIANPEEVMREHGGFEMLLQDKIFNSHLISIIVDEAHCISQWGSFRSDYHDIGRLRFFQRKLCPILATSATMSAGVIEDVKKVLQLREESLFVSRCSTDRSNIAIIVRPIINPIYSYRDLAFVLGNWEPGNPPPPKFIVFFDNIKDSIDAGYYLRGLLPKDEQRRINWFNSDMSDEFKRSEAERLAHGETWGLLATDSFGMGMDLPDIKLVVQYRAPTSISMLWQRFGRCVRDPSHNGFAILLAEKEYFDHLKNMTNKRKRGITIKTESSSTNKRVKWGPFLDQTNNPLRIDDMLLDDDVDGEQEDGADDERDEDEDGDKERDEDEDGGKEMRRDKHKRAHGMKKSKKKSKKDQIEPAIMDLLNAGQRGFGCRRRMFIDTFQNSKAVSLHLECDPSQLGGCPCCRPARVTACCDIHNPELLSLYPSQLIKIPRQPGPSRLIEKVTSDEDKENQQCNDMVLRQSLELWRRNKMETEFGEAALHDLGPSLLMGEKVRDRIVNCARHGKIKTVANLERETKWTGAAEFGSEILEIIEKHHPSPIIDLTGLQSLFAEPGNAQIQIREAMLPRPAKRQVTCSLCGGQGHMTRSKKRCPLQNGQKDNVRAPGSSTSPASAPLPSAPITPTSVLPSPGPITLSSPLLSPLSPIFASTLSASTRSTLSTLSPSTIASLASHLNSISLSSTKSLNTSN